jgi:hypothetical protein
MEKSTRDIIKKTGRSLERKIKKIGATRKTSATT